MVSHQVETNVVTQVERPPVTSRESDPAAPPRAAADDRQNSSRMRCPHHGPPTCRTIFGGDGLLLICSRLNQGRGAAPHPPGIVPGGRAGRGMARDSDRRSWDQRFQPNVRSWTSRRERPDTRSDRAPLARSGRSSFPCLVSPQARKSPPRRLPGGLTSTVPRKTTLDFPQRQPLAKAGFSTPIIVS